MLNKLRSSGRSKGASAIVWAVLGLLVLGLTGLGLGGAVSGLSSQNVASVGDQDVKREDYVRQLFSQMNAFSQQVGQPVNVQQARLFGLDQQVLSQMVTRAALDGKTADLGLSVGDRIVADRLLEAPQFQGVSGKFDQAAYEYYLNRNNLSASEYENQLRRDLARGMLELGVAAGSELPPVLAETIVAFTGERRSYAFVALASDDLAAAPETPDEDTLRAFYDENPDLYTSEETRVVTYTALTPTSLAPQIEVSDDDIAAEYETRKAQYNKEETRVLDVLAFGTQEEAETAKAAIDAGETTFGTIAEERGLNPTDLSLGAVTAGALNAAAREVVFGATEPGTYGPVATDLGPSLYRLNAIIAATSTPLEEVSEELRAQIAERRAQDEVLNWIDPVVDLVASGATIEEIANETPLELGEISLTATPSGGLGGDLAFRRDAFEAKIGEERDMVELTNGGIAVLRLDRIDEAALIPYDEVAEDVAVDWRNREVQKRLVAMAEDLKSQLDEGRTFGSVAEAAGLTLIEERPTTRNGTPLQGIPQDMITTVFDLDAGTSTVISDLGRVYLVQTTEVLPVDTASPEYEAEIKRVSGTLNGSLAQSLYLGFAQMLTDQAGVTVNQKLIDDTLAQYP